MADVGEEQTAVLLSSVGLKCLDKLAWQPGKDGLSHSCSLIGCCFWWRGLAARFLRSVGSSQVKHQNRSILLMLTFYRWLGGNDRAGG
jgi:hypothetical protein